MNVKRIIPLVLASVMGLAGLAACQTGLPQVETQSPDALFTQAAQTVMAELTRTAGSATPTQAPPAATQPPAETPTPLPTDTLEPTATSTLTPTVPAATATIDTSFTLLLEDDFSNERNWPDEENDGFSFGFTGEGYTISVDIPFATIWVIRGGEYGDVRVETDARLVAGPNTGYYGVMCRQIDDDNYYALVVGGNGAYGIGKLEDGEFEFLQEGVVPEGVLRTGDENNRVRGDCIGESLTLYVNDQQLASVNDDDFEEGLVGLVAGARLETGVEAVYSRFAIFTP